MTSSLIPFSHAPVIGISCKSADSQSIAAMVAQVRAHGGIPRLLTNHTCRDPKLDIEQIDALFVMGNDYDVDPKKYIDRYPAGDKRHEIHPETDNMVKDKSEQYRKDDQARTSYEEQIILLAKERKLPMLAVCAGMQKTNVLFGGGLLQHVPDLVGNNHHMQLSDGIAPFCAVMPVTIERDSALGTMVGATHTLYKPGPIQNNPDYVLMENSIHHQACDPDLIGKGLRVVAWSDQFTNTQGLKRRLPEALEPDPNGPLKDWPMVATQWHPEFGASPVSANIIATCIARGASYAMHHERDRSMDETAATISNVFARKDVDRTYAETIVDSIKQTAAIRA